MILLDYLFYAFCKCSSKNLEGLDIFTPCYYMSCYMIFFFLSVISIINYVFDVDLWAEYAFIKSPLFFLIFYAVALLALYINYKVNNRYMKVIERFDNLKVQIHPVIVIYFYLFICCLGWFLA